MTYLVGQILPMFALRFALNDEQAALFFIAQFSGNLTGALVSGFSIKKFGFLQSASLGFFLITFGLIGVNAAGWLFCWLFVYLLGVGIGLTVPVINLFTVELNPTKQASALNFINFVWGCGAIMSQPFVWFFGTKESFLIPMLILAVCALLVCIIYGILSYFVRHNQQNADESSGDSTPIWTTLLAWLITIFSFVQVGIEAGLGGWLTTYSLRMPAINSWLSATPVFFLFLVVGRGLATQISKRLNDNQLIYACLFTCVIGNLILFLANNLWILLIGAAITGLGTSAIFPTNMARFAKTFGASATRRATPIFIFGSLGATFTTWLVGFSSTYFNNLRAGIFILLIGFLILIGLQTLISTKIQTHRT